MRSKQNCFGKLLLLQVFGHIDFEEINRVPHFSGAEHRIDRRQNHSGNGDDRPFLASAFSDALVFQRIVRIFLVLYCCVSNLYQCRLEVNTGTGDAHRLLFSGRFVIAGSQSGPAAKPLGGTKLTHIRANFRDDGNCRIAVNTQNGAKKIDLPFVFCNHLIDTGIYLGNHRFNEIVMLTDDFDASLLLVSNGVAFNGLQHLLGLLFEGAL